MVDFLIISTRSLKKGVTEIYPNFVVRKSSDLMIRGGDFYAIWVEEKQLWSTDEDDVCRLIDKELDLFTEKYKKDCSDMIIVKHMWDSSTGMIDNFHKYCQKQLRDNFHMLDEKLIFSNTQTVKTDYASKRLSYPLEPCEIKSYNKLMSTLYTPEERTKIEWAIGAIVSGESKKIQKFLVLYGSAGTGKSTVLNIIQQLFEGYYSVFDARALGSSSNSFALESFKTNPLVAIQHDGDLSHIEDNTRLNSLVSHELMSVNEKFKSSYSNSFKSFLFMGTNKPVKITDAKSGLIRRLIDVSPSGNKLSIRDYRDAVKQVSFELGGIATYCLDVYLNDPDKYDDYIPINMLGASNDFYNFVSDSYLIFKNENGTSLKASWEMYKVYCEEAKVPFPLSQRVFKEELKNYFDEFKDRYTLEDGSRIRNYYSGFKTDKFEDIQKEKPKKIIPDIIKFTKNSSIFDKLCGHLKAQYATINGTPFEKWDNVTTTLNDIDTSKLHYVKLPENHIVIDFDIPNENGEKDLEKNLEAASKWPETYAELSKSGSGIHLHYIYSGDVSRLSKIYDEHIEIKVFTGNSSLRRMLTKNNNLDIATISSGLPLKGEKMVNFDTIKSEKGLRNQILRNLNKEIHPATKPSIDFIYKILEDAYSNGLHYDVTDMRNSILTFAASSTNQADYCIKLVNKMQFKSEEASENVDFTYDKIVFYDIEVFPNLFLVNWKLAGPDKKVVRMINPTPSEISELVKYKLVGFNNRRYDNHIMYARILGYTEQQLFELSTKIVTGSKNCFFGEAYNLSYTDVYDFAAKKQSLKKWEIELGIHHQELGLPWDQPVSEDLWNKVAEYCDNDVIATEAVFDHCQADFTARKILADIAGMTVNDTTNSLTTRIIFGKNKNPQSEFNYRDLGKVEPEDANVVITREGVLYSDYAGTDPRYTKFNNLGQPVFPGYKFIRGKSFYRDIEVGEGGRVYGNPGMYGNAALLDIASMHPSSVIDEDLFGKEYTKRFEEIKEVRVAIKHKDFAKAKKMMGGVLAKYLDDEGLADNLAQALKIAINSVYGLTSAKFSNAFKDPRNDDNIVAKRGALFMINLQFEVEKRGFTVAHIKTDSIKIPDATMEIIDFVVNYGKMYGYDFEHEGTYERICLVNDVVYIAKFATVEQCIALYGEKYVNSSRDMLKDNKKHPGEWTATGTQFQIPYVFKTLFTKEPIEFEDLCETKSVTTSIFLDMNENLPDVTILEDVKEYRKKFPDWDMAGEEKADKANRLLKEYKDLSDEELCSEIAKGHSYVFIGKVGQFCPIKPGCNAGVLCREKDGKYYAVGGSKGYRWLESEYVKTMGLEFDIDLNYYKALADSAIDTISEFGDYEWFVSNDPYIPAQSELPWYTQEELEKINFSKR